ncbi:hypothetical protein NDU88_008333 [Pleurodeles waltl]|uniref:Uncharacterized protein n=1 Tax=Pleurodeles waltl TaxID=8319 RepID=A0AAV7NVQ0_PLEWA|nr:hypothetical protein NDU88_008333 [Pleurodeles waltl]
MPIATPAVIEGSRASDGPDGCSPPRASPHQQGPVEDGRRRRRKVPTSGASKNNSPRVCLWLSRPRQSQRPLSAPAAMPITAPAVTEGSRASDGPGRRSPPKVQCRRARSSKVRSKMGGVAAGRFQLAPLLKEVLPGSGRVSGLSPLHSLSAGFYGTNSLFFPYQFILRPRLLKYVLSQRAGDLCQLVICNTIK